MKQTMADRAASIAPVNDRMTSALPGESLDG